MVNALVGMIELITIKMIILFDSLRTVYIDYPDNNISLFSVFMTIIFLDLVLWFIMKWLNMESTEENEDNEYSETGTSSANEQEIDFDEEIIHENP